MLGAVGIACAIVLRDDQFTLEVAAPDAQRALDHLGQYEAENRPPPPPPAAPPLHAHAWVGCAGYAAWLLGVAYAISNGLVRLDAFNTGELDAARVQSGQWWRAWTALTLHVSGAHLAANLTAGIWFGYLAGRQLGVGVAWLLIVAGGGARKSGGRAPRSAVASVSRRLHCRIRRVRPHVRVHMARASGAAAEVGSALGSARSRDQPAGLAGYRRRAHRCHGSPARLRDWRLVRRNRCAARPWSAAACGPSVACRRRGDRHHGRRLGSGARQLNAMMFLRTNRHSAHLVRASPGRPRPIPHPAP